MVNGQWSDFIGDFMDLTEENISPRIFREWSSISAVSAAMERRVWVKAGPMTTFPNLYTLLVAPPGVGKFIIEEIRDLMTEVVEPGTKLAAFKVAPDSMSKASLMDTLAKSKNGKLIPNAPVLSYHSLFVAAEEFSVLLPAYDLEFIGVLNSIYNNKSKHTEVRRTGSVKELDIQLPQLNILGGTQPGWLGSVFPEEAWSTGLASRLIMIYSPDTPVRPLFEEVPDHSGLRKQMLGKLTKISQLYGQMLWEPEAADRLNRWHISGGPPIPTHSKLAHYTRRRTLHVIKLSMISAVSRTGGMVITFEDVERGIEWLTGAEAVMPDIFRAMVGKSDVQVIEEMHYYLMTVWAKDKAKPVRGAVIRSFLLQRIPSDKVDKLIDVAEKAGVISRLSGTEEYTPRPRGEWGIE